MTESQSIETERFLTVMRDKKTLATELGVSREYINAMRHHGFKMPGGKASIRMAREFLASCDEFIVRARPQALPQPPDESCDRSHAPSRKRVRRKPSSGSRKIQPHKGE